MSPKYIKAEIHLSSLQESAAYAANVLSFQLFFFIDIAQALVKRCIHASSRICPSLCRRLHLDELVVTTYGQMLTPLV